MSDQILSNQRYCTECFESIFSAYRHDYKTCKCGAVMVDGGMDYIRQSVEGFPQNIVVEREFFLEMIEALSTKYTTQTERLAALCNVIQEHRNDISPKFLEFYHKALIEAIEDPTRNVLGHLCNLARVLRDKCDYNLTRRE